MNKKETLEIRKLFSADDSVLHRICTCYVDYEKKKVCTMKEAFLSLEKDEALKYNELFRSTLTGTMGRNLLTMEFSNQAEKPGSSHELLMQLRASELKDEGLIEEFYDRIITAFDYPENYYIVLVYGAYDIPKKTTDGFTMDDASDEVYNFLLCSICPVSRSKGGLGYLYEEQRIGERIRDWMVQAPIHGFLFPAFSDRSSDIHHCLYLSKNPEDTHPELIDQILGAGKPSTPKHQKATFDQILATTLEDKADVQMMTTIHDQINEMIAETKDAPEPLELGKTELRQILKTSGVPEESMERFESSFTEVAGDKATFPANNLINTKKMSIETPDIVIKVNSAKTDLIQTKVIDGRTCLVITVDEKVEVNGMEVRTIAK